MALWVSPAATPNNLLELLQKRGLRCRKHFPAMLRRLDKARSRPKSVPTGLEIRRVTNLNDYDDTPYPANRHCGVFDTGRHENRKAVLRKLKPVMSDLPPMPSGPSQ
jgi:hypothetical protein